MRAWLALSLLAGCLHGPAYKLSVPGTYEVGEDATVGLQVRKISDDDADIVITRPDGSIVRQHAPLDAETTRIRFAPPVPRPRTPPTFTMKGTYRIELRAGHRVLAKSSIAVTVNHLDDLLPDEVIADYKPISRFTRDKQAGDHVWKTYGALYEHPFRVDARIEVLIEEPGAAAAEAWKPYEEDGTLGVVESSNVLLRERADSAQATWRSADQIVTLRAPTLADLERGLLAHFLSRFPSKLSSK